jgi:hypothetical protein
MSLPKGRVAQWLFTGVNWSRKEDWSRKEGFANCSQTADIHIKRFPFAPEIEIELADDEGQKALAQLASQLVSLRKLNKYKANHCVSGLAEKILVIRKVPTADV